MENNTELLIDKIVKGKQEKKGHDNVINDQQDI